MAWTAPVDKSTGDIITATIWNQLLGATSSLIETAGGKVTTAGDMVYGTAANAVSRLGIGSANTVLRSSGTAPQWGTVAASEVTGWGNDKVVYTGNSGTLTELGLGSSGTFLKSNGATSAPTFATPAVAASAITGWGNDKILYTGNSGTLTELPLGASGEVLTAQGATSAPTFAAAAGGGAWECVAASNTATSFSSTTAASVLSFGSLSIAPGEWFVCVGRVRTTTVSGYNADVWLRPTSASGGPYALNSGSRGNLVTVYTGAGTAGWWWFMGCVGKDNSGFEPTSPQGGAGWSTMAGTNAPNMGGSFDNWASSNISSFYAGSTGSKIAFHFNETITALDVYASIDGGQLSAIESVYVYKLATSV